MTRRLGCTGAGARKQTSVGSADFLPLSHEPPDSYRQRHLRRGVKEFGAAEGARRFCWINFPKSCFEQSSSVFRSLKRMEPIYSWAWVEAQAAQTIEVWNRSATRPPQGGRRYSPTEQQRHENAYDEALEAVETEVKRAPRTKAERIKTQDRMIAAFARFSATALGLEGEAIKLLTDDFLPVGTTLARWARRFDERLSMADIIQACRNAWTACGLQPLLGTAVRITPAIIGYSLLYPYSDNYLDHEEIPAQEKLRFSERFRSLLRGEELLSANRREKALRLLIAMIEGQYPRDRYPRVFECLLAIHRAQEQSVEQPGGGGSSDIEVLRKSCAKGGSSVVADACLVHGGLDERESRFAFDWGVLLQLGDDLQDLREDMRRGSITLFSRAAASGEPLDSLAVQLLNFGEEVGSRMDGLPHGGEALKTLLKMSWRSLIITAVAHSHEFFLTGFLKEAEHCSPFRFEFLRARQQRLASRQGLYTMLFDAFLEAREDDDEPQLTQAKHMYPESSTRVSRSVRKMAKITSGRP